MTFNPDYIKPIDFSRAAVDQAGVGSKATLKGQHMWDWQLVRPNGTIDPVGFDLNAAAIHQQGGGYMAVNTGVHAYQWGFMNPSMIRYKVIPIVLVTSDKVYDIAAVNQGVDTFKSLMIQTQEWVRQQIGKTMDYITPIVAYTSITSAQCAQWNIDMKVDGAANQRSYYDRFVQEVKNLMKAGYSEQYHRYLVTLIGAQQDGSATYPPIAVVSSDLTNQNAYKSFGFYSYSQRADQMDGIYCIAHELYGHGNGIDHPPLAERTEARIMWNGRPAFNGGGKWSDAEAATLFASPFFR